MSKIRTILTKLCISALLLVSTTPAKAQLTPDNTLGAERSVVTPNTLVQGKGVNADLITGGAQRGRNLFHSFSDFNVNTGQSVYFANPSEVTNILTRVTGGNASNIFGTLGVDGLANLFLINPNGIVFGKGATLDLKGSFVGTTANGVQFGNQGLFSATNPQAPPLLTIDPSGLLFNQLNQQATITNQAGVDLTGASVTGLRVPDGKSLLLIGGDVVLDGGKLNALGGRVELGGLASPGTVGLQSNNGNYLSLSFPLQSTRGSVSLLNGANVTVSASGGGSIAVNASNLNITGGSSLIAGIRPGLGNIGAKAGDITINATGDIKLDGSGSGIADNVGVSNSNLNSSTKGNGGNIEINTNQLELTKGAQLQTTTFGQGNGGSVIINAAKSVSLDDNSTGVFSRVQTRGVGNAGNIQITTDQLSLTNGARLVADTYGKGNAGNVIINATKSVSLDSNNTIVTSRVEDTGVGNAGNIQVNTGQLSLTNSAQLIASTLGQGNAGDVIINAIKSVTLDGSYTNSEGTFFPSGIFSRVGAFNNAQNNLVKGNGGNIQITTDQLSLTNGAQLVVETYGKGNAGNVIVNAGQLSLTNGAQLVADIYGKGNAGNVIINATKSVSLDSNNTRVSSRVQTGGVGNAGNIQITTDQLSLTNGAQLIASTLGQGNAGNVIVNATNAVNIAGVNNGTRSGIFSQVQTRGVGKGGNIDIHADSLSLEDGATLSSSTFGQGSAGSMVINATKSISLDNGYILTTVGDVGSTQNNFAKSKSKGGNLQITTDELSLSNGALLDASSLGQSDAGNIEITAGSIRLDKGFITAITNSGNGGNIKLTVQNFLLLLHNSQISTSAGAAGDGGNITINSPFIVAIPNENSDITANANFGAGGQININARLFGIQPRQQSSDLTNDITAFSQQGVQGQINVAEPQVDLVSGLVPPPIQLADVTSKFSQLCPNSANPQKKPLGSFVITGRGSIPPNPLELLPGRNPDIPLANAEDMQEIKAIQAQEQKKKEQQEHNSKVGRKKNKDNTLPSIVEAQGIVQTPDGQIYFVANANHATPSSQPTASPCPSEN